MHIVDNNSQWVVIYFSRIYILQNRQRKYVVSKFTLNNSGS